ncbi:hypothetical protein PPL_06983 [Heterostelium album PN500]|uniref:Uncharacterized protein n=1 Tax=Heterostelium pallidum (strain ATCC 26659 / Pp 5 / PN500) TaxID=670386 RepID=D3BE30_HETP5|nr:hypothetical protein PPL_06983 [Heterostelium album PN500]EFA80161.1 hypothetical protein PPL_06983 [Heterostelium album PN500]|eukprot:XP_020432281.1 hypothetical protein PPL_06983 [Heterostelium album PN500]
MKTNCNVVGDSSGDNPNNNNNHDQRNDDGKKLVQLNSVKNTINFNIYHNESSNIILLLNEIATLTDQSDDQTQRSNVPKHIKTIGSLLVSDTLLSLALVIYNGYRLVIDFKQYSEGRMPFLTNSLHHFIGELTFIDTISVELRERIIKFFVNNNISYVGGKDDGILIETVILKARLFKNIDTMDTNLFESALLLKRKFQSFLETI